MIRFRHVAFSNPTRWILLSLVASLSGDAGCLVWVFRWGHIHCYAFLGLWDLCPSGPLVLPVSSGQICHYQYASCVHPNVHCFKRITAAIGSKTTDSGSRNDVDATNTPIRRVKPHGLFVKMGVWWVGFQTSELRFPHLRKYSYLSNTQMGLFRPKMGNMTPR